MQPTLNKGPRKINVTQNSIKIIKKQEKVLKENQESKITTENLTISPQTPSNCQNNMIQITENQTANQDQTTPSHILLSPKS